MKFKLLVVILGVVATVAVSGRPPAAADVPPASAAKQAAKPLDWKDDPVCQMVFFAVLEGLYSDGVPDDVVECIVPKKVAQDPLLTNSIVPKKSNDLQRNFVPECPICHPVYEAFALYQNRPSFRDDNTRNTFGKAALSDAIVQALKSDDLKIRVVGGIRPLVEKYVAARLNKMNLSAEERQEWSRKLTDRVGQGTKKYGQLRATEAGRLLGWGFYGGCGACTGTEAACKTVLAPRNSDK